MNVAADWIGLYIGRQRFVHETLVLCPNSTDRRAFDQSDIGVQSDLSIAGQDDIRSIASGSRG